MSTSKRTRLPSIDQVVDAGQAAQRLGRRASSAAIEVRVRCRRSARVPVSTHRPAADDADPVAEPLHLGQDVAAQQHGVPVVAEPVDALLEDRLHQRVEPGGRLVEDEQLDVGGERGDERDLLPVALGVGAALLGRVQLEPLDQLGAPLLVEPAAQPAEQVDGLAAGEVGPQVHVAGHVGQPAVQLGGLAPRVAAEQPDLARVLAQQAEQHPDGRGLAGAVGAEEAVHLARATVRSSPSRARTLPKRLDQAADLDRGPVVSRGHEDDFTARKPPNLVGARRGRPRPSQRGG